MTAAGTLARYVSWRFLIAILGVFTLCLVLIFIVDFIELLRRSGRHGSVPANVLIWMTLLRLPSFSEIVLPFAVLLGSIGAFLMLSRSSELIVIRAAGVSVWQFMLPGAVIALAIGLFAVGAYNPLAAWAKAESERVYAEAFGRQESLLQTRGSSSGAWLRQDGADGQSIIHARHVADQGLSLSGVIVFQFDRDLSLAERIEAETATLQAGRWELDKAWISAPGREAEYYERYIVSTYLTPTQVRDSLASVESISFWELQNFIGIAERAGLSASRHKMQFQTLLSRPFVLVTMVLVAATCSLAAFRFGKVGSLVVIGLIAGFAFFVLAEVSRNLGSSGLAAPAVAAWAPVIIAGCLALTVLLHQEDG